MMKVRNPGLRKMMFSLESNTKSLEKVAILLKKVVPILKCEQCEFEARNQNGLTMHMKAKHTETKAN